MRNVIVIGASAGGMSAIVNVLEGLPNPLAAAVIVVIHMSRKSNSQVVANHFQRFTQLRCMVPADGQHIHPGHLYIAPADHHMMVKGDHLTVNQGPHENKYRPSIDVLFRSAAVEYGHRTIGIILTGMLEDGTSGMWAIKKGGGICIVQEPSDAEYSEMPRSVLNNIDVHYRIPLHEFPTILNKIFSEPLPPKIPVPKELQIEADITANMMTHIDQLKEIADRSDFVCPDCGGGQWLVKDESQRRYRCHTGHVYTEKLLQELQDERIEESLWVAIRLLEEKHNMYLLMSRRENKDAELSPFHKSRIDEVDKHIKRLKSVLTRLNEDLQRQDMDSA